MLVWPPTIPTVSTFVMTVIRLLCNSFSVNGTRFNSRVVVYECYDCGITRGDPVAHAVLRCNTSHELRENFWRWILDNMPLDFCGYISQLDDEEFLDVVFGQHTALRQELLDDFRVQSAYFVHRTIELSNLIAFLDKGLILILCKYYLVIFCIVKLFV